MLIQEPMTNVFECLLRTKHRQDEMIRLVITPNTLSFFPESIKPELLDKLNNFLKAIIHTIKDYQQKNGNDSLTIGEPNIESEKVPCINEVTDGSNRQSSKTSYIKAAKNKIELPLEVKGVSFALGESGEIIDVAKLRGLMNALFVLQGRVEPKLNLIACENEVEEICSRYEIFYSSVLMQNIEQANNKNPAGFFKPAKSGVELLEKGNNKSCTLM